MVLCFAVHILYISKATQHSTLRLVYPIYFIVPPTTFMVTFYGTAALLELLALVTEAVGSSETSVAMYQLTRRKVAPRRKICPNNALFAMNSTLSGQGSNLPIPWLDTCD